MKFVTLFLKTENVHLLKDVGMIPYYLHKHHGYDSSIVTYRNEEEYPYLHHEVKGLNLDLIKQHFWGKTLDGIYYLCRHAKEIDILNVYHLNLSSFFWLLVFRCCRRRETKSYLKLDMNPIGLKKALAHNPVGWIKRATIRMADVVSVETTSMQEKLNQHFMEKILYLPNGCYVMPEDRLITDIRENIILTVGNLGTQEKATDVLLEGFAQAKLGEDWRLVLVGPMAQGYDTYVTEYYEKYPNMKSRVTFLGEIRDKERLHQLYRQSKIFAFPSRSESFGIALIEAINNGCYVVTTKGVPLGYDICREGAFGSIVDIDDARALAETFTALSCEKVNWEKRAEDIRAFAQQNFSWDKLIDRLAEALEK